MTQAKQKADELRVRCGNAPWQAFRDAAYFDMWCVRQSDERYFGQGYHLVNEDEATHLADRLNKLRAAILETEQ